MRNCFFTIFFRSNAVERIIAVLDINIRYHKYNWSTAATVPRIQIVLSMTQIFAVHPKQLSLFVNLKMQISLLFKSALTLGHSRLRITFEFCCHCCRCLPELKVQTYLQFQASHIGIAVGALVRGGYHQMALF